MTGRLKGRKATGTVRIVLPQAVRDRPGRHVCDTGKRKWTAQLDEILVELP